MQCISDEIISTTISMMDTLVRDRTKEMISKKCCIGEKSPLEKRNIVLCVRFLSSATYIIALVVNICVGYFPVYLKYVGACPVCI